MDDTTSIILGIICVMFVIYIIFSVFINANAPPPVDSCDNKCSATQTCQNGTCITTVCKADTDCPTNQYCASGVCANDEVCYSDLDCTSGQICSGGQCVAQTQCAQDGDCADGQMCQNMQCVPKPQCNIDSDCSNYQVCDNQKCINNPYCVNSVSGANQMCGDDGYGRSCGVCDSSQSCTKSGTCAINPPTPVFQRDTFLFSNTTAKILLWSMDYTNSNYRSHHMKFHMSITYIDSNSVKYTYYDDIVDSHELMRGLFFPMLDYQVSGTLNRDDFKKKLYTNDNNIELDRFQNYKVELYAIADNGAQSGVATCNLNYAP